MTAWTPSAVDPDSLDLYSTEDEPHRGEDDMTAWTPEEIATEVLAAHEIKPHWQRSGEQIHALIVEAIRDDRAQYMGTEKTK